MRVVGLDLVVRADARRLRGAHHQRDVGAVDVGVDQSDALSELGERDGQVDGDRGFADPALTGSDGDDLGDSGKRYGLGRGM